MHQILFIILFLQVSSTNYLAVYRMKFDDCLKGIYTMNTESDSDYFNNYNEYYNAWDNVNNNRKNPFINNNSNYKFLYYKRSENFCTGEYNQEQIDLPLNKLSYDYGIHLHFEFADTDPTDGSMKIAIKINEYIISTSNTNSHNFWKCYDCMYSSKNFESSIKDNDYILLFHPHKTGVNDNLDKTIEYYYHFSFKVDSLEDIKEKGFDVNENFYTIKSQTIELSFHIEHVPEVIDLINFNTIDNFYITQANDFLFEYQNYYYKINYLWDNTAQGKIEAYDRTKSNKVNLTEGNSFQISDTEGLKYYFVSNDIKEGGFKIVIKITAYNCIYWSNIYSKKVSIPITIEYIISYFDCLDNYYKYEAINNMYFYYCSQFKK